MKQIQVKIDGKWETQWDMYTGNKLTVPNNAEDIRLIDQDECSHEPGGGPGIKEGEVLEERWKVTYKNKPPQPEIKELDQYSFKYKTESETEIITNKLNEVIRKLNSLKEE